MKINNSFVPFYYGKMRIAGVSFFRTNDETTFVYFTKIDKVPYIALFDYEANETVSKRELPLMELFDLMSKVDISFAERFL